MSASALLASTGKRCSQLLPHRVRPSTLGFLGVGRSLRPCLNAQVGKLRLLIVSPPYARKHGGAGRVTRSLQIHHVSSQGASTCRAAPTSHLGSAMPTPSDLPPTQHEADSHPSCPWP